MDSCSAFFRSPLALEIDRRNLEKYDTTDLEEIDRIEKYKDKCVEEEVDKKLQIAIQSKIPEIQEQERENARKLVREEYRLAEGVKVYGLSRFISETVTVNGVELYPNIFIPDRPVDDPISEDVRLYFDDTTEIWLVRVKNGLPKRISRFVVTACLIVDASGPGSCRAYVVFLKGEAKPLIFWEGIIEAAELRKQTQFHKKGLSYARKDLYHESFMRALSMCSSVYFLTLPRHAGWNWTPEGLRIFVDSEMMQPQFEDLFLTDDHEDTKKKGNKMHNVFLDVSLSSTDRKFDDVVADYHSLILDTLPMKIGTVISAMSRLLPFYKEEGLVQDKLWVVETADDATAKTIIAVMQNRNHRSTEALFSSMRMPYIEEEITHYVDCVAIMRHSCTICSTHDCNKIVKYLYELLQNGYADDDLRRLVPVLFVDNAGIIPEDFQIHQISIADRLKVDSIEQILKVAGEIDYYVVKLAEQNPDAVKQRIKAAVTNAKEIVLTLPRRSQSSSAVMLLSTAIMLKEGGAFKDADVQGVMNWLRTEAKSRTSMSRCVCNSVGAVLSRAICIEHKSITYKDGPQPWTPASYYVAEDDSINVSKDDFDEIISELLVVKNTALKYLKTEDVLIANKGEEQKTWKVENEDGIKKQRRFYAFSRELLTPEANRIIDETMASDLFQRPDEYIDNFFPLIKHNRLDMVAGQIIEGYNKINPFMCVTGGPNTRKTTFLMMRAFERAMAGEIVLVTDSTNAFCREELKEHGISDYIIDKYCIHWDICEKGWPVDLIDFSNTEDIMKALPIIYSLLVTGTNLYGNNQLSILTNAIAEMLINKGEEALENLASILYSLDENNADEKDIQERLRSLFVNILTVNPNPMKWEDIVNMQGKILILSTGRSANKKNVFILDVILDSLYMFKDKHRKQPITIVVDEIQKMNMREEAPLNTLLSLGRKLNISILIASQRFSDNDDDDLGRLEGYCDTKAFGRPMDGCLAAVSRATGLSEEELYELEDGFFAILGPIYSKHLKRNKHIKPAVCGELYRLPELGEYNDNE